MLKKLAKKLTDYYIQQNEIPASETEKYNYSFELLLATILNVVVLVSVGVMFQRVIETLIYLIIFAVLRSHTGGYHANSHLGCVVISVINCLIMYYVFAIVDKYRFFTYISVPFSLIIITVMSPIESENKPLEKNEKRKQAILSRILIVSMILVICISVLLQSVNLEFVLTYGVFTVAISVVAGYIKNKKKGECYD